MENPNLQLLFRLLDKIDGFTGTWSASQECETIVKWLKPEGLPSRSSFSSITNTELLGTQCNVLSSMLDCDKRYVMINLVVFLHRKHNGNTV